MLRRFLLITIRRSFLILLLICLGCVAQSTPPDVARKIERQVRSYYTLPADVKITVGDITPSGDLPGYDAVSVIIDSGEGKSKDYKFLIAKDRSNMLRVLRIASDLGITGYGSPATDSPGDSDPIHVVEITFHELGGLAYYFVTGNSPAD